jgi:hypothetical protein
MRTFRCSRRAQPRARPGSASGRWPRGAVADELGDDGHRDLVRRLGGDVQADGRVGAGDGGVVDARDAQRGHGFFHLAGAADHADVGGVGGQRAGEDVAVVVVVVGGDDHEVAWAERRAGEHVGVGFHEPRGVREALWAQPVRPLIDHSHREPGARGQRRGRLRDVAGAEHDQARRRLDGLDEDLHLPSAAHAELGLQVEREEFRAARGGGPARVFEDDVLDAPSPDGTDQAAVVEQQQTRADHLRRVPTHGRDQRHHPGLAARPRARQLLENVRHPPPPSWAPASPRYQLSEGVMAL